MKKSRPGILLTVICHPQHLSACEAVIFFSETTTLGIRRLTQQRSILHREIQSDETEYGVVRVKVASPFYAERLKMRLHEQSPSTRASR